MANEETLEQLEESLEEAEAIAQKREITIDLKIDEKKALKTMKDLEDAFSGVKKNFENISSGICKALKDLIPNVKTACTEMKNEFEKAFSTTNPEEYAAAATRFGEGVAGALLSANENINALEDSIVNTTAPVAGAVASMLNEVLPSVTSLVDGLKQTISDAITHVQPLVTWLWDGFLQPIAQWTGGVIIDTLQLLAGALGSISIWITEHQALVQVMTGIITAFAAAWVITDIVFFIDKLGGIPAILSAVTTAINQCTFAKLAGKAEDMAILTLYAVDYVKQFGAMITQLAANTAAWVANTAAKVASTAAEWAHIAAVTVWNGICATATAVTSAFGAAMSVLTSPITLVVGAVAALIAIVVLLVKNWDTVKEVAVNTWNAIVSAFGKAGAWFKSAVLDPLANGFKGAVNGVIGFLNGLIAGVVKGINGLINLLNKLSFAVPDWVPGMGGKTFGFNLKPLTAPQIPYLAKGAVLPANRPFLAMVGDQRHGTNIEAPLATIQEAMAITMEDFVASNMAGHEATVGVLKEILEAVLGIHIGDADIGKAVQRYQQKMAVVYGRPY